MTEYKELAAFAREAAAYFERRDTGGEDMAFWANVTNAENCRKLAAFIESQQARIKAIEAERDEARRLHVEALEVALDLTGGSATAEARCKRLEEALRPFATGSVDVSGTAVILDSLSARDARDAARLALQEENTNGG